MVFDKDFKEMVKVVLDGHKELKRKLDKKEICELTVGDFYKHLSDVYGVCEKKYDDGIEIPISKFLNYFDDMAYIIKETVYCSVFRNFILSKNKGWFKVKCLYEDETFVISNDGCFNVRCNAKLSDVLDKIYKIAYDTHISFFSVYDHCDDNDIPFEIESLMMQEFIIRNAEKYDIDWAYGGAGMVIYNIGKKWIV
jgi:hypothetical protein